MTGRKMNAIARDFFISVWIQRLIYSPEIKISITVYRAKTGWYVKIIKMGFTVNISLICKSFAGILLLWHLII